MITANDVEKMLDNLIKSASKMSRAGEELEGLIEIRGIIVDHPPSDFAAHVGDHTLSMLYIIRKLVADIWVNFGTDATFDFSYVDDEIREFSIQLASFLKIALEDSSVENHQIWKSFTKVVRSYCLAIESVQKRLSYKID